MISQEAGQVVWYSHLFKNVPQFVVFYIVKGFGIVNKAEIDIILEFSCFSDDPAEVGNLISGLSAFSKYSFNIRKSKIRKQNVQKNYKKRDLHDQENHDGVITHLEPDILECKVGLRKHHYEQNKWRWIEFQLSLAWRVFCITLVVCEKSAVVL